MSSRLIVKNIPKKISDARLRDIFGKHGEVTQVKVLSNRRFAYVGFHSEKAAATARRYLHDTYIDTSKIEVLDALAYGDSKLPRPWSKYSSGSSAHASRVTTEANSTSIGQTERRKQEKHLETEAKRVGEMVAEDRVRRERDLLGKLYALKDGAANDPELSEFWDVMGQGKRQTRTWANDAAQNSAGTAATAVAQFQKVEGKMYGARGVPMVRTHITFDDSEDEYQELPVVDGKESTTAKDGEQSTVNEREALMKEKIDNVAHDDSVSDVDYLRSKMGGVIKDDGTDTHPGHGVDEEEDNSKLSNDKAKHGKVRKKSGKMVAVSPAHAIELEAAAVASLRPTVRLRGLPFKATEEDIVEFFHPLQPLMIRLTKDRFNRPSGRGFVDFHPKDVPRALKFNGASMQDRYIEVTRDVDEDPSAKSSAPQVPIKPPHKFADKKVDPTLLGETGRIFVRNLSYLCTEDELEALMTKFGPVSEVLIPLDRETKKSKAIGFVTFLMPEHAIAAYQALDGQPFQGRLLHLLPAEEKRDHSGVVNDGDGSYKKHAERKRKAQSGAAFNWNTLFLRSDAVAGAMATDYGVSKSEILDAEADGSMAVRMALGETHVVAENKRFLQENGVVLNAFDTRVNKRSTTTILVKNTPFETTSDEIRSLFTKFGDVGRVIFPPSHTMAVVEMFLPQEARNAFKGLAYRKFKHVPLYLEWAPEGCLVIAGKGSVTGGEADHIDKDGNEQSDGEPDQSDIATTLFVKNLSFGTSESELRVHFERTVAIRSVRIATKRNTKDPRGLPLSMGFGFVEFSSRQNAMKALKTLQHSMLDGHKLELKLSTKKDDGAGTHERGQVIKVGGTKLLIRNLPFEANKKELRELCQPFGSVKSIRIPKKFDGEHRGFAFIEFLTKKEAKSAFEALSLSTHLYGRRLVIEWAQDDESLEALQSKTRAAFSTGASKHKRVKIDENV